MLGLGAGTGQVLADEQRQAPVNLRVRQIQNPDLSSLHMRRVAAQPSPTASKNASAPGAAATTEKAAVRKSALDYKPIPTEGRDIRERVLFKTNIGYGLDVSRLSGDVAKTGIAPGDVVDGQGNKFAEARQYLLGDAIVGTRGVLMPSLNSYFLARYSFNAGGDEFTALNTVYDAQDAQKVLIRSAYAELEGLGGPEGGVLDSVYVRAGRQYRFGSNRYIANFDGVTAAYDHRVAEVSGFFGQRVSLYFDDDPGILAGGSLKLRGQALFNYPIDLNVDYLRFDSGGDEAARQVVETNARWHVATNTRVYVRGRYLDDGLDTDRSAGIGRVGAQIRQSIGRDLLFVVDAEKNFAREFAFDYVGSSPIDVVNVGQDIGLAIGRPQNSTLVGARANYQITPTVEGYGFYRNRLVKNQEEADAFARPFQEIGLATSALFGNRLTATAQYKYRLHSLEDAANAPGSDFGDTAGTGVKKMHEISGEARYNFGKKKADFAVGAYGRIYDIETPYAFLDNDGRGGGRFEVGYWATSFVRLRAAGEVAQPSQSLAADIDTLVSLRFLMEASF